MGLRDGLKRRAAGAARRVKRAIAGEPSGPSAIQRPIKATPVDASPNLTLRETVDDTPPAEPSPLQQKLKMATTKDPTLTDDERGAIRERVVDALKTIFDPEIPVNIWELGLVYGVEVLDDRTVDVKMTLTSPNCPAAQSLPGEVQTKASNVDGAMTAVVDIVWDPPWTPERMSEEAQLELNLM